MGTTTRTQRELTTTRTVGLALTLAMSLTTLLPQDAAAECARCDRFDYLCCDIPGDDLYYLTSFTGGEHMACGGYADGSWYYATSWVRWRCGAKLQITNRDNGACVVVEVADAGPAAWVEDNAGMPIIDASTLVCRDLFGSTSCGWSDGRTIEVIQVADSTPSGPGGCGSSSGGLSWIGGPCDGNDDCSSGACLTASQGFPGGTCTESCDEYCPDRSGEPDSFCVTVGAAGRCVSQVDWSAHPSTGCRAGYSAQEAERHGQSWVTRTVCLPTSSESEPEPDPEPEPEPESTVSSSYGSWIGGPCRGDGDCVSGRCFTEEALGYPEGMCSEPCSRFCPDLQGEPSSMCLTVAGSGYCFARADSSFYPDGGCRDGYHAMNVARHGQPTHVRPMCLPEGAPSVDRIESGTVNGEIEALEGGDAEDVGDGIFIDDIQGGCSSVGTPRAVWLWPALAVALALLRGRR